MTFREMARDAGLHIDGGVTLDEAAAWLEQEAREAEEAAWLEQRAREEAMSERRYCACGGWTDQCLCAAEYVGVQWCDDHKLAWTDGGDCWAAGVGGIDDCRIRVRKLVWVPEGVSDE